MNNKKSLMKEMCWLMLLIALERFYDLFFLIRTMGELDTSSLDAMQQAVMPAVTIIMSAFLALHIVALVVLIVKGLREVKSPSSSKYHIILAYVLCALNIPHLLTLIDPLFNSTNLVNAILDVVIAVAVIVILFVYAKVAKALRVEETEEC